MQARARKVEMRDVPGKSGNIIRRSTTSVSTWTVKAPGGKISLSSDWRSAKYEEIYLHACDTVSDTYAGIGWYFEMYNRIRPHSSLKRKTPYQVY